MGPRFYVPDLEPARGEAVLSADESHHLTRVLRLRDGDEVAVFDGRGVEWMARVRSATGRTVRVELTTAVPTAEAAVALTVAQSVLKPDAMEAVVHDCVMVGVHTIVPVISSRTAMKTASLDRAAVRWRRIALAAAKQSGRARLPDITPPLPLLDWLNGRAGSPAFILVEPSVRVEGTIGLKDVAARQAPQAATVLVGPEGGWTAEELDAAIAASFVPLSLGRLTLRAGSAPLAACAALLALWD